MKTTRNNNKALSTQLIKRINQRNLSKILKRKIDWNKELEADVIKNANAIYVQLNDCPYGVTTDQLNTVVSLIGRKKTIKLLKFMQESSAKFFETTKKGHYWKEVGEESKILNWELIFNQFLVNPIKNKDSIYLDKLFFNLFEDYVVQRKSTEYSFIHAITRAGNPVLFLEFDEILRKINKFKSSFFRNVLDEPAKKYDFSIIDGSLERLLNGVNITNDLYELNREEFEKVDTVSMDMLNLDKFNRNQAYNWLNTHGFTPSNKQLLHMNPEQVNMKIIRELSKLMTRNKEFSSLHPEEQNVIVEFYKRCGDYSVEFYKYVKNAYRKTHKLNDRTYFHETDYYLYRADSISERFLKTLKVINEDVHMDLGDMIDIMKVANALQYKTISNYFEKVNRPFSKDLMDRILLLGNIVSRVADKDIDKLPLDIFLDFEKNEVHEKLFEELVNLYLETCDVKLSFKTVSGRVDNDFHYELLDKSNHVSLIAKYATDSREILDEKDLMRLNVESDTYYVAESEYAGVIVIYDKNGSIYSSSIVWLDPIKKILVIDYPDSHMIPYHFVPEYKDFTKRILEANSGKIRQVNIGVYNALKFDNYRNEYTIAKKIATNPKPMDIANRYFDSGEVNLSTTPNNQKTFNLI